VTNRHLRATVALGYWLRERRNYGRWGRAPELLRTADVELFLKEQERPRLGGIVEAFLTTRRSS
jgi:hypothetical protein